jgi:hypothetical protein
MSISHSYIRCTGFSEAGGATIPVTFGEDTVLADGESMSDLPVSDFEGQYESRFIIRTMVLQY